MKLIGLVKFAKELKVSRKLLLGQLEAIERERNMCGLIIVRKGKGKKVWVNRAIFDVLQDMAMRELEKRIAKLEGNQQIHEIRLDLVENATRVA
jgi:hypothetical protein